MISIEGIEQRFGSFELSVSLEAPRNSYLVVLGPSGAGKSLLLGIVAGTLAAARGVVRLGDREVTNETPDRRGIGMVFQQRSLFPHLSVADNIAFGLKVRGVPRPERKKRVDELVETLGLGPLLARPAAALSGGESQKVTLARALAPRPEVLLLDEPLSRVDHNNRLELQQLLREVHDDSELTTMHVTHDRDEARAVGDRCAVMLGGRVVQQGGLQAVLQRPACAFVAHFLGLDPDSVQQTRSYGETADNEAATPGCSMLCMSGNGQCDRALEQKVEVGS